MGSDRSLGRRSGAASAEDLFRSHGPIQAGAAAGSNLSAAQINIAGFAVRPTKRFPNLG